MIVGICHTLKYVSYGFITVGFLIIIFNCVIPLYSNNMEVILPFGWLSVGLTVILLGLCIDHARLSHENIHLIQKL